MTRAWPLLLVLAAVACAELPSTLPTAPDPAAPPAASNATLAGAARGGVALMVPDRCAGVATVHLEAGVRDEDSMLVTARYLTLGYGTPASNCTVAPLWSATSGLKIMPRFSPVEGAFAVRVLVGTNGGDDRVHRIWATAPNGVMGMLEVTPGS